MRSYFDNVRHDRLLAKVAKRVHDDDVMHLLKIMLKANGRCGVPQGGVVSPLKVLEQHVDTSTSAGRAFFGMFAVFAAFETDVRRERQAEGIAKAERAGRYQGGVKRIDRARVQALKSNGAGPSAIAQEMGISRRQVYRILDEQTP